MEFTQGRGTRQELRNKHNLVIAWYEQSARKTWIVFAYGYGKSECKSEASARAWISARVGYMVA